MIASYNWQSYCGKNHTVSPTTMGSKGDSGVVSDSFFPLNSYAADIIYSPGCSPLCHQVMERVAWSGGGETQQTVLS